MGSKKKVDHLLRGTSCISCGSQKLSAVAVIDQDGIPPGKKGHNIGYSHVILAHCQKCDCGLVERLDHDCFDWEKVFDQYEWYLLDESDFKMLMESLRSCPDPMSSQCLCDIHRSLRTSLNSLPMNPWGWSLESTRHVHKVLLKWLNGLPELEAIEDQNEN